MFMVHLLIAVKGVCQRQLAHSLLGFRHISQTFFRYGLNKFFFFRKLFQDFHRANKSLKTSRRSQNRKGLIKGITEETNYPNKFIGSHRRSFLRDINDARGIGGL